METTFGTSKALMTPKSGQEQSSTSRSISDTAISNPTSAMPPPPAPLRAFAFRPRPRGALLKYRPSLVIRNASETNSPEKLPQASPGQPGPNTQQQEHVSEEAAKMAKIEGKEGPDLDQGTPVQEVS